MVQTNTQQACEVITIISRGTDDRNVTGRIIEVLPQAVIVESSEPLNLDDQLIYDIPAADEVTVRLVYTVIRSRQTGPGRWRVEAGLL